MELEPITRQEKIIAGQDLTPITRMEMFLKQFGGGGGGGGGSADAVLYTAQTLTDAQKKQARENIGAAGEFVINGTLTRDMTVTLDKTFEQINEAINVGKTPIVLMNNRNYLKIVSAGTDFIVFSSSSGDDKEISFFTLYVYPSQNPQFDYVFSVVLNPDKTMPQVSMDSDPAEAMQIATKKYVDGKVASAGSSDFVVNGTANQEGTVTLDKTFVQINEAANSGKNVFARITLGNFIAFMPLTQYDSSQVKFAAAFNDNRNVCATELVVAPSFNALSVNRSPGLNDNRNMLQISMASDPTEAMQIATKKYVDDNVCILHSTTPGSTKKFKITVDDSGAISATEVTA